MARGVVLSPGFYSLKLEATLWKPIWQISQAVVRADAQTSQCNKP
jgi:hypothetical protein